ncbi:MAG: GNAT family N-acetyltransferase [Phycisphaerae bacterium]
MATRIRQLSEEEVGRLGTDVFQMFPVSKTFGAVFMAETEGEVSGGAAVSYVGSEAEKGVLHIDHFVVMPAFRGHGLGGRLMKVILDHAKALSIRTVRADIPGWCPEWRAFYARFGFVFMDPTTANSTADETPVELRLDA